MGNTRTRYTQQEEDIILQHGKTKPWDEIAEMLRGHRTGYQVYIKWLRLTREEEESTQQQEETPSLRRLEMVLQPITCYKCGLTFGLIEDHIYMLRRSGNNFYCPNGHPQAFVETEEARLEKQLIQEAKYREQLETELQSSERSKAALRGVVTRTRNRIAKGVCPCCNRQFQNLHRHMETQHPDYEKQPLKD
jgi:hypothetical protein